MTEVLPDSSYWRGSLLDYQLAVFIIYLFIRPFYSILLHFLSVRWGSHTLWQVLVCVLARATCQCVWMRSVGLFYSSLFFSKTASLFAKVISLQSLGFLKCLCPDVLCECPLLLIILMPRPNISIFSLRPPFYDREFYNRP